ncbi:MAG: TorF family putative porin, partial [Gammaproteobacteria bacterium]
MNRLSASILGALLLLGGVGNVLAEEDAGPFAAGNFSATTTFTTDYVFRGISFSGQNPAIQGSLDWGYSGFY